MGLHYIWVDYESALCSAHQQTTPGSGPQLAGQSRTFGPSSRINFCRRFHYSFYNLTLFVPFPPFSSLCLQINHDFQPRPGLVETELRTEDLNSLKRRRTDNRRDASRNDRFIRIVSRCPPTNWTLDRLSIISIRSIQASRLLNFYRMPYLRASNGEMRRRKKRASQLPLQDAGRVKRITTIAHCS